MIILKKTKVKCKNWNCRYFLQNYNLSRSRTLQIIFYLRMVYNIPVSHQCASKSRYFHHQNTEWKLPSHSSNHLSTWSKRLTLFFCEEVILNQCEATEWETLQCGQIQHVSEWKKIQTMPYYHGCARRITFNIACNVMALIILWALKLLDL